MSLIGSSVKYPITVIVVVLIAVFAGLVSLSRVPVQLTPEVESPIITVTSMWPGASPGEIEKEIVDKQEEYLKSVEGVLEMNSESSDGMGVVTLEFPVGTDISAALVRVTNKLNEVPTYPQAAERPIVSSSSMFEGAIAWFVIKSDSDSIYVPHLHVLLDDLVKPRMERVPGVSRINLFGGLDQELHVVFDPQYLASSGITISQLQNALRAENRDVSAGDFSEGKRRYVVRTISRYESIENVERTVITVRRGVPIRVGDVASVELAYQKPSALVRHKGRPAVAFNAQRQIGANVLDVLDGLINEMEVINKNIMEPRGLRIENVYRESVYINSAIALVKENILIGGILAVLVMFFFLRSISTNLIIGVSIPICVIVTFLTMAVFGRTINVISLAGMAFAVGMIVDAAIVVIENIYRHVQMGKTRWQASLDGATEVWGAVLASTVTTIAVFLPIMFVQERAGQLFKDISIAMSSAIAMSLIVSISVIPSLASRVLKVPKHMVGIDPHKTRLGRFADRVARLVDFINSKSTRRLVITLGIIVFTLGLSWILLPPAEYLPNGNQNFVFGVMLPPPGYNMDEMIKIGEQLESQLKYLWDTPADQSNDLPGGGVDNFFFVATLNLAFCGFSTRDEQRGAEIVPVANQAMFTIPGTFGFAQQWSLFSDDFAGTRSIRVDVTGPELEKVLGIAGQVFMQMGQVVPGSQSRPIPGLDLGNPEVRVYPDRVRAADVGYTSSQIGEAVNALVDGANISEYYHEGHELDLILRGEDKWSRHTQDVAQLPLATPSGRIVTVGDVAKVEMSQGPVQINHVEKQRAVSISTTLPDNIPLEAAIALVQEKIVQPLRDQGQVAGLYDIKMSGAADDLSKLRSELITDFILAIILTYLLLVALFQSFTFPFVIMLTVPLATFGGVIGLRVVQLFDGRLQLDVLTMLGFVILVGTVVNNAILIVYQALDLIRSGTDYREAVKEAVRIRVRPIFMSTATSVFGMLPLVIMPGAGSELYRGLGSVVIGGLALSTLVTLVLTPLVFTYAIELTAKVRDAMGLSKKDISIVAPLGDETT
jgi:HAE1 family hydrophobic/amphiphilic exporter-1